LTGEKGRGGLRGKTARKAVLFKPGGRHFSGVVRRPPDSEAPRLHLRPHTQHPGGRSQIPRRWMRVKRKFALGELKRHITSWRFDYPPMLDGGLRGKARSTHPTSDQSPERNPNRLAAPSAVHPRPSAVPAF